MNDTWVCALICFWEHKPWEEEPLPVVAIVMKGSRHECEAKAVGLRRVRPEDVDVVGKTRSVRDLKIVTCPEALLGENDPKSLPS